MQDAILYFLKGGLLIE